MGGKGVCGRRKREARRDAPVGARAGRFPHLERLGTGLLCARDRGAAVAVRIKNKTNVETAVVVSTMSSCSVLWPRVALNDMRDSSQPMTRTFGVGRHEIRRAGARGYHGAATSMKQPKHVHTVAETPLLTYSYGQTHKPSFDRPARVDHANKESTRGRSCKPPHHNTGNAKNNNKISSSNNNNNRYPPAKRPS